MRIESPVHNFQLEISEEDESLVREWIEIDIHERVGRIMYHYEHLITASDYLLLESKLYNLRLKVWADIPKLAAFGRVFDPWRIVEDED
jgi:hypothetical protein